jgi:hypothetical protein
MQLLAKGIKEVKTAVRDLGNPSSWSPRIRAALNRLYPGGLRDTRERKYVESQLQWAAYKMGQSYAKNASNISIMSSDGSAAYAHPESGNINFKAWGLSTVAPEGYMVRVMIHEHTHLNPAHAGDLWYVNDRLTPFNNRNTSAAPFNFSNAAQNADTLAMTARIFSTNEYSPG